MTVETTAATAYAVLAAFPMLAQVALALGAPWGRITMGGRWPGRLPPAARIGAALQAVVLATLATVALDHGGVLDLGLAPAAIWGVVAVACVTAVLNNITPSRMERRLWGLPTVLMAVAAVTLAIT